VGKVARGWKARVLLIEMANFNDMYDVVRVE